MNDNDNIARIKAVFNALGDLGDKVVFVGGAAVCLYRDRPASETRITDDVDVVVRHCWCSLLPQLVSTPQLKWCNFFVGRCCVSRPTTEATQDEVLSNI